MILWSAMGADDSLPDDVTTLKAMLRAERAARLAAEAEAQARDVLIEKLKLTIAKLRHEQFGQSSERGALLDQLELQLAELEENAAQAETAAADGSSRARSTVPPFERRKPARRPLPEHLPRERVVYPAPAGLPMLRRQPIAQDRRGRHRDAGARAAPVEGDPARAREVLLPGLRGDHASRRRPRIRLRAGAPGRSCWPMSCSPSTASTCRSTGRATSMQREGIDLDVSTLADWVGACRGNPDAAGRCDPEPCLRRRAHPRR